MSLSFRGFQRSRNGKDTVCAPSFKFDCPLQWTLIQGCFQYAVAVLCTPKRSVLPLICKGTMVFVRIITYSANPCILGTDWDSAHFSIPLLSHADNGRREGGIILKALRSFLFCEACSWLFPGPTSSGQRQLLSLHPHWEKKTNKPNQPNNQSQS